MVYSKQRSVMVVEQVEYTNAESVVPLLKVLYPLLRDAFMNNLSNYCGQSTEVGFYASKNPFRPQTDYTPETFFTIANHNWAVIVVSDTTIEDINDSSKILFNENLCKSISGSPYIDKICELERGFRSAIESRAETINYLREFEPATAFKWYYTTGYYQKLCRGHCRRLIINVLEEAIANLATQTPGTNKHESIV